MKRFFLSALLSAIITWSFASGKYQVEYSQPQAGVHQVTFTTGSYNLSDITLDGAVYSRIGFESSIVTQKKGFAALPYLNASVMIDPVKNVSLQVFPGEFTEISLSHPLVPSRGVIYRDQDPATVPYSIDPRSVTDSWYPVSIAENSDPFILRDIRGTNVYVYPFQYNAARQVLRIYKSVTVNLVEENSLSINPLPQPPVKILLEMDAVYSSVFINYYSNRDNLTIGEFGDIHVIVTSRDEAAIQPYVDWKREKGYNVSMEVVPAGTTVNETVQAAYNNNNDILYVLLVGDWADLQCTTNSYGRPMDPQVGTVVGTDYYADIAVGRFSAESPADVTVQVNKVINYEKLPEMGGTWYSVATGIASDQGGINSGDDLEADAVHETIIYNDKLDPFTYNGFNQIFDPGATPTMVFNAVNNGTGVINYTGHGSGGSWGTTGFNISNVAQLANANKLPFVMSVACNNGDFDLGTCFAEAWMRKSGGGAIMFLGASISQPWDPPMRGQDYFMDLLIGGYDYTAHPGQNGISTTEQRTTLGSIVFNGLTLMCTESGGDLETAQTWNLFGDPALQARTATPAALSLSNSMIMVGIPFSTTVTSGGNPVANAMVTLSQNGLYFSGITDVAGAVTIAHDLDPGTARLVVTGFNTGTIYQDANVTPPNGPYVVIGSVTLDDPEGNGNGLLDYGEAAYLTIGLVNLGTADASAATTSLASTDPNIIISDQDAEYGLIPAGDTVFVTHGFAVQATETIPDLHPVILDLEINGSAKEIWISSFILTGHAPVLEMSGYTINDAAGNGNGHLDAGETAVLTITGINMGSADAYDVSGLLAAENPYITVNDGAQEYGDLASGITVDQSFEISIDEAAPSGSMAVFSFDLTAGMGISGHAEFTEYIGQIPVLLIDWDGNHSSPDGIEQCLTNLVVGYDKMDALPAERNLYSSIFVCLGTYPDNHVLTPEEGQMLAEYLSQGGNLYMEGADTWFYDPQNYPVTPVHDMFYIEGMEDGVGDLVQVNGQPGSLSEEMSFLFTGENSYIDHIGEIPPAQMMFMNNAPAYGTAVSYDAGTYKTIGFSFEFGGLADGEKSKDDLMISMLEFFGIEGTWTEISEKSPDGAISASSYPNPFRAETVIRFETGRERKIAIEIRDLNGRLINKLFDAEVSAGRHEITWNGCDKAGNRVKSGVYFYRIDTGDGLTTGKLVLMD